MKPVPLPTKLSRFAYYSERGYSGAGWLAHCAGIAIPEYDQRTTRCQNVPVQDRKVYEAFEAAVAEHYGVAPETVARLERLIDGLRPEHRVPKFKEWCQQHGVAVVESQTGPQRGPQSSASFGGGS